MRADDDITEDGDVTEDSMQELNDGNNRSFSVTADPFCELLSIKHIRLVERFPFKPQRVVPAASDVF